MHWPFQYCIRRLEKVLRVVDKGEIDMSVKQIVCRVED